MSAKLPQHKTKILHTFVMKNMFLCKHAWQNLLPGIVFIASRVKEPNKRDWEKVLRIINYLKATKEDIARMSANDTQTIK